MLSPQQLPQIGYIEDFDFSTNEGIVTEFDTKQTFHFHISVIKSEKIIQQIMLSEKNHYFNSVFKQIAVGFKAQIPYEDNKICCTEINLLDAYLYDFSHSKDLYSDNDKKRIELIEFPYKYYSLEKVREKFYMAFSAKNNIELNLIWKYIQKFDIEEAAQLISGQIVKGWIYTRRDERDTFSKNFHWHIERDALSDEFNVFGYTYIDKLLQFESTNGSDKEWCPNYDYDYDKVLLISWIEDLKERLINKYNYQEHYKYFVKKSLGKVSALFSESLVERWQELYFKYMARIDKVLQSLSSNGDYKKLFGNYPMLLFKQDMSKVYSDFKNAVWTYSDRFNDIIETESRKMKEGYFNFNGFVYKIIGVNQDCVAIVSLDNFFGEHTQYQNSSNNTFKGKRIRIPQYAIDKDNNLYLVKEILRGVFDSAESLEEIYLPQSIERIEWSFWNCHNLKHIYVDENNKCFCDIDGVVYSKDKSELVFYPNNYQVNEYIIPEGVERIRNMAFKDCLSLEYLTFPSTLRYIGINSFYNCKKLKDVYDVPNTLEVFEPNNGNLSTNAQFHYKGRLWYINEIVYEFNKHNPRLKDILVIDFK